MDDNPKGAKQMKDLSLLSNEELWKLFPIRLEQHNPSWKLFYETESALISNTLNGSVDRISHFGSTALEGLLAKPTIDILLEIYPETDLEELSFKLKSLSYLLSPQPDNPAPHMMFLKGYTPTGFQGQAVHLHIRYRGDWGELYFRDYLKDHPNVAAEYAELKRKLARNFTNNRDGYTEAKGDFIRRITRLAREAYPSKYN